jgi:hypothetical protein
MSLASILNQVGSSKSVSQIKSSSTTKKCINCEECNIKAVCEMKKIIPIQNMEAILDVDSSKCSPRQYRNPLATACKKFVSRMVGAICNMKPQSSSLVFPQGALCCSDLREVLDTYHTPRRSNLSLSSSNITIKQDLEDMLLSSRIDNFKIGSNCNVDTNNPLKVAGDNTTYFLKLSTRELQNNQEVTGLCPLLSLDNGHHTMCNIEPPSYEGQTCKEIQQPPQQFKQFDFVCGAINHHFIDLAIVR